MFGRKRVVQQGTQAPALQTYVQGPILTNGALEFIYRKPVAWPLFTMWGPGIINRAQLNVLQPEQQRYHLSLTKAPIVGAGVPAGYVEFAALLEQESADQNE